MSLEADYFADRRRLKRRLVAWQVAAVLAGVATLVVLFGRDDGLIGRPHVARLSVDGLILDDKDRAKALAEVAGDSSAKALIVRIDSPGGTVVGGESLYRGLRAVAENKPVVAVMGELATSGGYMTALAADHIVASPGTVTGSIGVLMQTTDMTGLLDKLGIKPEAVKSSPLKAQPNPLEPFTDEARAATRAVVMDMYEMFVGMVVERRGLTPTEAKTLADGRVFTGRQALAVRLVDALGGEKEARAWLAETRQVADTLPVRDVKIRREDDLWRDLVDTALGKVISSERLRLDGLISVWHPGQH
jgi:protease-4